MLTVSMIYTSIAVIRKFTLRRWFVNKPKIFFDDPTAGANIFQPYNHHYGHAGFDFINRLFEYSKEDIKVKMTELEESE